MDNKSVLYLIPCTLDEAGLNGIPPYVTEAVKKCQVFFVENERSARRYLKKLWKEIVIDEYEWFTINGLSDKLKSSDAFRQKLKEGKTIGIISEAGCPGIADPGQLLVAIAQQMNVEIRPLVGPNSILLALMASGMNGQRFQFVGYLPIDNLQRNNAIKELETESQRKDSTQIFIETPYRNNQLIEALTRNCKPSTKLCIAVDLTSPAEWIKTKTIKEWSGTRLDIHKRPAIFLIYAV